MALRRPLLPGAAGGGCRSTSTRCSRARTSSGSRAGRSRASGSPSRGSSSAATSSPGPERTSTRSASTSTAAATCASSPTSIDNHGWTDTMLHELGHGVYDLGFDEELPWVLRDTHLVTTEASALLFGALAGDREWLERVLGVDGERGERARSPAPLRSSCRAPGLHALGAGHERVRARALCRP